ETRYLDHAIVVDDVDDVIAVGRVDDDGIRRVRVDGIAEVERDLADPGPGQIIDRDRVGTSQRRDIDVLDAVEIHRHGADIAGEPRASAVSRDGHALVCAGAVELERIDAGLTIDRVATVARIPDEGIVTGAEICHVTTVTTNHRVIPGASDDVIVTVSTV